MNKTRKKEPVDKSSLSGSTTMGLRGHQSVRATFRLSRACIDTISILATQLGIQQKSVFDHLMEDVEALEEIARELAGTKLDRQERIQKSFVINRRSLAYLNRISKRFNAPRDAMVELSVRQLLPIIAKERKNHEKRKKLLAEISDHFENGQQLLAKVEDSLEKDDPIVNWLKTTMATYKNALAEITGFIEKGKLIEEFQSE